MPLPSQHEETLRHLVARIDRAGLRAPLALALDVLRPLDVVSSQAAIFVQPFVRGSGLERYAALLAEAEHWPELRRSLHQP
jgi:hypothetical protein